MPTETEAAPNAIALLTAPQTSQFAFPEALVAPLSPGETLQRLLQIEGVLQRNVELSQWLSAPQLGAAREELMQAIAGNQSAHIADAWGKAQQLLGELYASNLQQCRSGARPRWFQVTELARPGNRNWQRAAN